MIRRSFYLHSLTTFDDTNLSSALCRTHHHPLTYMQKIRFDPIRSYLCRFIYDVKNDIPFSQCKLTLVAHAGGEQQVCLVARSRSWHILELKVSRRSESNGRMNRTNHLVFSSLEVTVINRPTVPFVPKNERRCSCNKNMYGSWLLYRQASQQRMRGTAAAAANQRRKDEELCNFRHFIPNSWKK